MGPLFASFILPYPKQEYIAAYVIKQDTSVEFSNNMGKNAAVTERDEGGRPQPVAPVW
jgi:hypothetical protein